MDVDVEEAEEEGDVAEGVGVDQDASAAGCSIISDSSEDSNSLK